MLSDTSGGPGPGPAAAANRVPWKRLAIVSLPSQYRLSDPWLLQPLPPYGTLSDGDYAALGFRCGLEIHQQLLTVRKLFCRCPAGRYHHERHDAEILRHMRPTLSEMGEYDGTALMEFKTRKEIVYLLKRETVCTYEMDDAPPPRGCLPAAPGSRRGVPCR